jgi:hypothetical protein
MRIISAIFQDEVITAEIGKILVLRSESFFPGMHNLTLHCKGHGLVSNPPFETTFV